MGEAVRVLHRLDGDERPTLSEATRALSVAANAGVHPASWPTALSANTWRAVFSAKPDAMKAVASGESADAPVGRFLTLDAEQTFTADGRVDNSVGLLWGAIWLAFCGTYTVSGRAMTIVFEKLRVSLMWGLVRFTLDIHEGRGLRAFIERWVRPASPRPASGSKPWRKRPNIYRWCYADGGLCIAQGSSGSVAVWTAESPASRRVTEPRVPAPQMRLSAPRSHSSGPHAPFRMRRRSRAHPPAMSHSTEELQLAAALVLPLLAYKTSAIVQGVTLQWYLDASIALATAALLINVAS